MGYKVVREMYVDFFQNTEGTTILYMRIFSYIVSVVKKCLYTPLVSS